MKYYEDIAKECWKRGLVCTLGAITLMPMTVWAAMNGSALWAVSSALAGVFCWFGFLAMVGNTPHSSVASVPALPLEAGFLMGYSMQPYSAYAPGMLSLPCTVT